MAKRGGKGAHSHSAPPLTRIVGRAAVVGRRKQGDQVPLRKPLEPVHHALVRAHDELQVVVLAERFDAVGPKRDEARPARARLHTLDRVVGGGVRPQQVHQHDAAVLHGERALQGGDLVDGGDGAADAYEGSGRGGGGRGERILIVSIPSLTLTTLSLSFSLTSVHAQNAVLDQGGQRQVVEQRVEARPRPHAVRVAQPLHALEAEPEQGVDVGGLVSGEWRGGRRVRGGVSIFWGGEGEGGGASERAQSVGRDQKSTKNAANFPAPRGCRGSGAPRSGARS